MKTLPQEFSEKLEQIARQIHKDYNAIQKQRYPEKALEYPTWESLPDVLKDSNIRQAQRMVEKLASVGCYVDRMEAKGTPYTLTAEEIENLAILEHKLWMEERIKNGWRQGPVKNSEQKITPYLVPYEDLSDEIKELDRDTVRNIDPLLQSIGMRIFKC